MSGNRQDFDRRIQRLNRKHRATSKAHAVVMMPDGLIHVRPRRQAPKPPLRLLAFLIAVLVVFKSLLLAHLGSESYLDRLSDLKNGSLAEQAGAWVMQLDPATTFLAAQISAITG